MKKINLGQKDVIHFIGIGGIGMSGLAQIMKNMGFKIQGSDQSKNKNTATSGSFYPNTPVPFVTQTTSKRSFCGSLHFTLFVFG